MYAVRGWTTFRSDTKQTMIFETTSAVPASIIMSVYIDVDGTIFVQMAAFLITLVMLHFLLYRPYLKALDLREENVEGSEEEAGEMGAQADVLEEKYQKNIRQARRDAQEVRESLRQQGLAEQRELHDEVHDEIQAKLSEERAAIDDHVQKAREDIEQRADALADTMVDKLLPNRG